MSGVNPSQDDLRCGSPDERGRPVPICFDGEPIRAYEGETIAAALLAAGRRALRTTSERDEPRGLFCNMGVCYDCLVEVDGQANVRACQTLVSDGMQVRGQQGVGAWKREP